MGRATEEAGATQEELGERIQADGTEALLGKPELQRSLSSAQGSLANILPVLEEGPDDSAALLKRAPSGDSLDERDRALSEASFDIESDVGDFQAEYSAMRESGMRTPGDVRTAVLEWMYEEKDSDPCPDLTLSNATILEDLISVFVCVVLHGKSDMIRSQVWRFLIQSSVASLHFAFLVICNLNASCHQPDDIQEDDLSVDYKLKRMKDLSAIERVIETIKTDALPKVDALPRPEADGAVSAHGKDLDGLRGSLSTVLDQLETVHDNQVLTNLDLNVRGRTARQNIDLLVQKVRNAILRTRSADAEANLRRLDGKIGFIKTLTDLDDWLRRSVQREERSKILKEKLESLSVALPLGAYFPTAVDRATTNHAVLRLVPEETIVFNTARKCPFLLVAEVEPNRSGSEAALTETPPTSPQNKALQALEMVSTKDFWKNPIKEIKQWQERRHSDASASTIHDLYDDGADADADAEEGGTAAFQKLEQEKWEDMQERVRKESPFGDRPQWQLTSMFVKAGDDLRQQQLGVMFVSTFQKIFLEEGVPVWLSPYKVIATGRSCGLLEPARNSDSIARIKERGGYEGIDQYFLAKFGPKGSRSYKRAQKNFMQSLAGYSIVAYLIKLHDRHNGNILIDTDGHLLHIDFGFMLGFSHKLERSPFKLTPDMVAILGGAHSPTFQSFRRLMEKAYIAANKHHRELILLAELMSVDESSSECFAGGRRWVIDEFRARFSPGLTTRKLRVHINDVIDHSLANFTTRCYDRYQRCVNGIW